MEPGRFFEGGLFDFLASAGPAAGESPAEATFNTAELVFLTRLDAAWIVSAALVLVAVLLLGTAGTRGAPNRVRTGLFVLRAAAALALLGLLLEPGLRHMATSREPNRVVVAVDVSESMGQPESDHLTRVQRALGAAQSIVDDVHSREAPFSTEIVSFDDRGRTLDELRTSALLAGSEEPTGARTRLAASLELVGAGDGASSSSRPLGGVVIISDGADTTGLDPGLTPELREGLNRLGAPVHTVLVGGAEPFRDIALDKVLVDDFAFVRNQVPFTLIIRHTGFGTQDAPLDVPVTLREDGQPLTIEKVTLQSDAGQTEVKLKFEPRSAGKHIYTLTLPVQPEEAMAANNRIDFTLKVIRDRIRVLQVAGRPSWDERFVRRLLKENPSVDLISFFILRSPTDNAGAASRELSLIPFPTRELFTEELHTFDVVIFQDFNYRPYQMGLYLSNIRDFVIDAGGGFMMIGGSLSFSEGEYDDTPIAEVLPVQLLPGHGHLSEEPFTPVLTAAGRTHPVTDLGDLARGRAPFAALPQLEGVNLVLGLAPGAETLLAHPYLNAGGAAHPVVAVREVGKGRSMAVLTDTTWLWSLPHVGAGGRGDAHRRFLANALRWLIRDPELSRAKVTTDRSTYEPGAVVQLEVRSFNARYGPEPGAKVRVSFTALDASAGAGDLLEAPAPLEGMTDETGAARFEVPTPAPGAWRVRVDASTGTRAIGSDEEAFVVRGARDETLRAQPRPDVLAALAAAGAGRAVRASDVAGLPFTDHGVRRVHRQRTEPLWDRWVFLLLAVLPLCGEWWWRRRRGFA